MTIREELEEREERQLSPYAAKSRHTKGRQRPEKPCDIRPAFQRDRDRILHCKSFRRLKQKTQVFFLPEGDHYRTRLTHTLEVSQIARTITKALGLNEDLTEAIALGHDLGHTPFGHAGERVLDKLYHFSHTEQGVRVAQVLEKEGRGLNLTWEVVDGIRNHQTSGSPSTLEGQVVRLADKFAYLHHDVDDAIRAGILAEEEIPRSLRNSLGETSKARLNTMVHDLISQSMGKPEIRMSPRIREDTFLLRDFLFSAVYAHPLAMEEEKAARMMEELFHYYLENPDRLPGTPLHGDGEEGLEQAVCDYIAGMTDTFAVRKFQEIFVPMAWI